MPDDGESVLDAVGAQLHPRARGVLQQVQHRGEPAGQLRQDQLLLQVRHGVQEMQTCVSLCLRRRSFSKNHSISY